MREKRKQHLAHEADSCLRNTDHRRGTVLSRLGNCSIFSSFYNPIWLGANHVAEDSRPCSPLLCAPLSRPPASHRSSWDATAWRCGRKRRAGCLDSAGRELAGLTAITVLHRTALGSCWGKGETDGGGGTAPAPHPVWDSVRRGSSRRGCAVAACRWLDACTRDRQATVRRTPASATGLASSGAGWEREGSQDLRV